MQDRFVEQWPSGYKIHALMFPFGTIFEVLRIKGCYIKELSATLLP